LQGFGLTLGSDLFLAIDARARHVYQTTGQVVVPKNLTKQHGYFVAFNGTSLGRLIPASFGFLNSSSFETDHIIKGISPLF
jgi:hypothetical protein